MTALKLVDADVLDLSAPLEVSRRFLSFRVDGEADPDLHFWQGDFWRFRDGRYEVCSDAALHADLYRWLERMRNSADGAALKPHKTMVERVLHALRSASFLDVQTPPSWAPAHQDAPFSLAHEYGPTDIVAFRNGLLHLPTRKLLSPSRQFFTLNALDFDYDARAPAPESWRQFLRDLWDDDLESIETLQEIFGLALTNDTRHQKAFLLIGPRRCGKGTIARVLTELVGRGNITAPMLSSLGQQFGLESMIGKSLALISDARLGGRADVAAIVENILRITGEDSVSVPRKFKTDWTAPLTARFVILSNELPLLLDQSGALAGRFILLRLTESFFGREDPALTGKLLVERPGILLWALEGLDRLRARGHFVQPKAALEMVRQLETLASPIKAFVAARCTLVPGASVECAELYRAWCAWTSDQGRDHAGSIQVFGRNLAAAFPTLHQASLRAGGDKRARHYEGVRLKWDSESEEETQ